MKGALASGYPWVAEAYGIKVIGTQKAKSKLSHVATVLAELLDQDNDGCVDDPNIMNAMLKAQNERKATFVITVNEEKNGKVLKIGHQCQLPYARTQ